jgi:hypothetical protein
MNCRKTVTSEHTKLTSSLFEGYTLAQLVSFQPLCAEAPNNCQPSPHGISSVKVSLLFLVSIIPPVPNNHSFIYHRPFISLASDTVVT